MTVGKNENTEKVLQTIRVLAADLTLQFRGGHAGTAMGAAALGVALWRDALVYNPKNPLWFGRDRFLLSVGHACVHQYMMLHFSGYDHWTLDEVKRYHAPNFVGSSANGHPEIEQHNGLEMTTGLLGQGIANAVGMAIAQKNVQARYTRPGFEKLFDNQIFVTIGDGCLQEGVGQEAISIAGHLALDNLVVIYDKNDVTVDGNISTVWTEDNQKRMQAAGWNVIIVERPPEHENEEYVSRISKALIEARNHQGQPTFVMVPSIIGHGSPVAGHQDAHATFPVKDDDGKKTHELLGWQYPMFHIPEEVYEHFAHLPEKGAAAEKEWNDLYSKYKTEHKEAAAELERRQSGKLPKGWQDKLPTKDKLPTAVQPTRKSSGLALQALVPDIPDFLVGSADLMGACFVTWKDQVEFQNPKTGYGDYSGRQIRYGIREHAMAALANGERAYFPQHKDSDGGGILPICATFYAFTNYGLPAIRMGALQSLKTIHIATHDSIGLGEDGPTHQPVGLTAFFRAEPGIRLYRPADAEEVMGCWLDALQSAPGPAVICLSRQNLDLLAGSKREGVSKGAYVVTEPDGEPNLVLVATGSEMSLAQEVAKLLDKPGIKTRVVSMVCMENFKKQSPEYRKSVIPSHKALTIAIESWAELGWARWAHAGCFMSTFGLSGPYRLVMEHFGFTPRFICDKIEAFREKYRDGLPQVGDFEELLNEHQHSIEHLPHHD